MIFSSGEILTTILLTPLVGAAVLLILPSVRADLHLRVANGFAALDLLASLTLLWRFHAAGDAPRFQFGSDHSWIPSLGVRFTLGLDGISLVMVMLTTVLGAIAIASTLRSIRQRGSHYYALMLLLQTGLLGIFLSLDLVLFYVFWELTLVAMYFLIAIWGGERRSYTAFKFLLYTLAGSVVMLLAILAIGHARDTFDVREILAHPIAQWHLEKWLFWGFFFAFAIVVPMFPFHTWMPEVQGEAPAAVSAILAALLLNAGVYGFLRFSVPMLPDAAHKYRSFMIVLSLIAIVYGALTSLMQKETKRLMAYSSFSQMGFCTLGIFSLTPLGLEGGVIEQISCGISMAALFLLAGIVYERRHTTTISELGGLASAMPKFAAIYIVMTLAALGMPLLCGFTGEFTVLRGVVAIHWGWAACALIGVVLAAASLLWLYQRVMFGSASDTTESESGGAVDLNRFELACLIPLVLLAFWIGLYPRPLFRVLDAPVKRIVEAVNPAYSREAAGESLTLRALAAPPPTSMPPSGAPAPPAGAK